MKITSISNSSAIKFLFRIVLPVMVIAAGCSVISSCETSPPILYVTAFSGTPTTVEAGQTVTFVNQSTADGVADHYDSSWSFPGGTPSTSNQETNVNVVYNTPGTYSVTLTFSEVLTKTNYITVTAGPQAPLAEFTASATTIEVGQSIGFTDQSTYSPNSWLWTFEGGNPATSTNQNPTGIMYASEGVYNVTLEATNAQGSNTLVKSDYIEVNPVAPFCSPVTDIDGNVYQVVDLAGSCWMKSNLKTSKYANGTSISTGLDSAAWTDNTMGAFTYFDGNASNNASYGKLYNWHAINSSNKICPTGWHPATKAEWLALIASQGGETMAGGALRSTTGWDAPNTGATNSSGFAALPGGFLTASYEYSALGSQAYFWTGTSTGSNLASYILMHNGSADLFNYDLPYNAALSCRCVKD